MFKKLPADMMLQESVGFGRNADGTFSRNSPMIAQTIDQDGTIHVTRCHILSLTQTDPPAKRKRHTTKVGTMPGQSPTLPDNPPPGMRGNRGGP